MKSYLFIGIDISKATLDVCVLSVTMEIHYHEFSNNSKGFIELLKWLKQKSEGVVDFIFLSRIKKHYVG
jgi:transposase